MTIQPLTLTPEAGPDSPVKIRLLGSLEVCDGFTPTAPLQRQALALLAWRVNTLTSCTMLVDELWEDAPPRYAGQNIQTYVYNVRRKCHSLHITTRAGGYELRLPSAEDVDVHRFDYLVRLARRALDDDRLRVAEDALTAAFSLWRGRVLEDVRQGALLSALIAGLEDRRDTARELRFEVDLRLGRHRDISDPLRAVVRANPTREDTVAKLMLALYRSRRRVEALEVFERLRVALEQLGIDPCAELRQLRQRILVEDPDLELEAKQ